MRRAWALLALAAAGCIPVPVALPPARASLGLGAALGDPLPSPIDGAPLSDGEPVLLGRIGLTPQALFPGQHRRPLELEGGYTFQIFTHGLRQNRNRHGVFLGIGALLWDLWLGGSWRARIVLRGAAEYLVQQAYPGDGGGGSWSIGFEAAEYASHESDSAEGGLLGYAAGELALGGELVGGLYSVGGHEYGTVGLALTARWPGALGVFLIPLTGSF